MNEFEYTLSQFALYVGLAIDLIAILIVAIGVIDASIGVVKLLFAGRRSTQAAKRDVWLRFAQWLIAGLTFQLAADIVHTAVAPSWDQIGKLAAIAVIRTLLTWFLDRDIEHARHQAELEPRRPVET